MKKYNSERMYNVEIISTMAEFYKNYVNLLYRMGSGVKKFQREHKCISLNIRSYLIPRYGRSMKRIGSRVRERGPDRRLH